jgi:hypothetical protein
MAAEAMGAPVAAEDPAVRRYAEMRMVMSARLGARAQAATWHSRHLVCARTVCWRSSGHAAAAPPSRCSAAWLEGRTGGVTWGDQGRCSCPRAGDSKSAGRHCLRPVAGHQERPVHNHITGDGHSTCAVVGVTEGRPVRGRHQGHRNRQWLHQHQGGAFGTVAGTSLSVVSASELQVIAPTQLQATALPMCVACRANPGPIPQVGIALSGPSRSKSPGHKHPSY